MINLREFFGFLFKKNTIKPKDDIVELKNKIQVLEETNKLILNIVKIQGASIKKLSNELLILVESLKSNNKKDHDIKDDEIFH